MFDLSNIELQNIYGGSIKYIAYNLISKIYRTIKIKLLMKKVFID